MLERGKAAGTGHLPICDRCAHAAASEAAAQVGLRGSPQAASCLSPLHHGYHPGCCCFLQHGRGPRGRPQRPGRRAGGPARRPAHPGLLRPQQGPGLRCPGAARRWEALARARWRWRGPTNQCATPLPSAAGCAVPAQPGRPQGRQPWPACGRLYGRCGLGALPRSRKLTNHLSR